MEKHEGCSVYGIHTCDGVSPEQVRDAIVTCFADAHSKELEDLASYAGEISQDEIESMKKLNVEIMIKNFFSEAGGDFNIPTKESIMAVVEKLAEFATKFRNQEVIKGHKENIMRLIECLK